MVGRLALDDPTKKPRSSCNGRGILGRLSWGQSSFVVPSLGGKDGNGTLLAWSDRAGQAAVVDSIGVVPQRLAEFNTTTQNFNLLGASGRCIGGDEVIVFMRDKVFIVAVTQDGFENVLAATHFVLSISPCDSMPVACGVRFE
jgi:hypothetical protein